MFGVLLLGVDVVTGAQTLSTCPRRWQLVRGVDKANNNIHAAHTQSRLRWISAGKLCICWANVYVSVIYNPPRRSIHTSYTSHTSSFSHSHLTLVSTHIRIDIHFANGMKFVFWTGQMSHHQGSTNKCRWACGEIESHTSPQLHPMPFKRVSQSKQYTGECHGKVAACVLFTCTIEVNKTKLSPAR